MIVRLVNWTPNPIKTVYWAYGLMKEKEICSIKELSEYEAAKIVKRMVEDELGGALEFVSTVWFFDGVSRAFQQQLTRHRQFGYCIQSLRVVDKGEFASKGQFHIPGDVKDEASYRGAMLAIQTFYNSLLEVGEPVEVARGILPLNVYSPIAMVANMRGLLGLFKQRMCRQVQGEFKEVVFWMIDEIRKKMSPTFVEHLKEPCRMTGKCQMSVENELRIQGKDALGRKPCSLYEAVRKK